MKEIKIINGAEGDRTKGEAINNFKNGKITIEGKEYIFPFSNAVYMHYKIKKANRESRNGCLSLEVYDLGGSLISNLKEKGVLPSAKDFSAGYIPFEEKDCKDEREKKLHRKIMSMHGIDHIFLYCLDNLIIEGLAFKERNGIKLEDTRYWPNIKEIFGSVKTLVEQKLNSLPKGLVELVKDSRSYGFEISVNRGRDYFRFSFPELYYNIKPNDLSIEIKGKGLEDCEISILPPEQERQ